MRSGWARPEAFDAMPWTWRERPAAYAQRQVNRASASVMAQELDGLATVVGSLQAQITLLQQSVQRILEVDMVQLNQNQMNLYNMLRRIPAHPTAPPQVPCPRPAYDLTNFSN